MKQRIVGILAAIALLAGLACLAYPFVSNAVIRAAQEQVAKEHVEAARSIDGGESERLLAEARQYNSDLVAGRVTVVDPFDAHAPQVGTEEYQNVLSISPDGVMAVIDIPKIGVYLPIYHGTGEDELQRGVGHLVSTSLPVGGETSHCVLAGHTGLPSVRIFDDLDQLAVGDVFAIEVLGEQLGYRVSSVEVVLPEQTESLAIVPGEDQVTLVTCTPYGVNSHRLLVHAARCELPDGWGQSERADAGTIAADGRLSLAEVGAIGIAVLLAIAAAGLIAWRLSRRRAGSAGRSAGDGT